MFKRNIKEELYLTLIANRKIRTNFTKLRISAHNLPIETGRTEEMVKYHSKKENVTCVMITQ